MKTKTTISKLAGDNGVKSKSFIHNATDTFHELALIFLGVIVVGGLLYSFFENQSIMRGFWWALVTAFTVGYGDVVPKTVAGEVVAGLLMTISVFIVVPLITARMASKMIVNDDAWTNSEQQYLRETCDRMNKFIDEQKATKPKPKVSKPRVVTRKAKPGDIITTTRKK